MKKRLMATALCSWIGMAHAAPFPDNFVAEAGEGRALPVGVILSINTNADGTESAASIEARAIDASDLEVENGAVLDPERLFASGRALAVADDVSMEAHRVPISTLVLPNVINIVTYVATTSGPRARYSRYGSWHRPSRHYYYYHRCGRYQRCR